MPKNGANTGKSSKTARVLSLLTDPAASLLGGSRNHKEEDDATEVIKQTRGLDDAATESRIQASLAAEEDTLVSELFGKKEPARSRPAESSETAYLVPPPSPSEPTAPEPDPRTLELLSMLSNPSTLGNSAMPPVEERRPVTLDMDFADELTAGMPQQPKFQPEPEPEPEPPAVKPYVPQQFTPQQQPAPQPQAAPRQQQPAPQPQQAAPQQQQYAPQQAAPQQQQYAPQPQAAPRQQQPAPPQQAAPQQQQPAPQPQQVAPPVSRKPERHEEFVCFNLTQALVEDKADKLMKQFGMCTCNRCRVDVTAIALSNLPAKYVATQNRDVLPLLSMYEEKYSAAVTVQVMNACRMVMKRPHHGR